MVAHASTAGGAYAPGPTPNVIYKAGTIVRLRCLSPVFAASGVPNGPFVIAAVIRRESLFGSSVRYELLNSGTTFEADPANVTLWQPPVPVRADEFCACEPPPKPETIADWLDKAEARPEPVVELVEVRAIRWVQAMVDVLQSADGRFSLTIEAGNLWIASDAWTGERSLSYGVRENAEIWCADRLKGRPLQWTEDGPNATARWSLNDFRAIYDAGRWYGADCRFSAAHSLRQSPAFDTREEAQAWCSVRAGCKVEGDPNTEAAHLHWLDPIPF